MDSLTDFEDEDDFFGSYDAERVALSSTLEFDDAETEAPSRERLAHLARFRRPVTAVVASMGLFSIMALVEHGSSQHAAQRELVVHYGSAIAAPTPAPIANATVERTAVVSEASSALVPEALSALVAEAVSAFVPEASSAAGSVDAAPGPGKSGCLLDPIAQDMTHAEISDHPDFSEAGAFLSALMQMCLASVGGASATSTQTCCTLENVPR